MALLTKSKIKNTLAALKYSHNTVSDLLPLHSNTSLVGYDRIFGGLKFFNNKFAHDYTADDTVEVYLMPYTNGVLVKGEHGTKC